jgi:hypothetical protein
VNGRQIDAVVVLEVAALPYGGGHRVTHDAHAPPFEVPGRADSRALVDRDHAVAEHFRREHGDRHERAIAVAHSRDVVRAGHLARVELLLGHRRIEELPREILDAEREIDAFWLHVAGVKRLHAIVQGAGEGDRHRAARRLCCAWSGGFATVHRSLLS